MRHIRLHEDKHQALRLKAFDRHISIQELLDEIVAEHLEREK